MKRILITAGEPAGIGPDLAVGLAELEFADEIIIVADKHLIQNRANELGTNLQLDEILPDQQSQPSVKGHLKVLHVPMPNTAQSGKLDRANSNYVLDTIRLAVKSCLNKTAHALVTGPVHKGIINDANIAFSGHTEFIGDLTDTLLPVMMLMGEDMRVAFVTTHIPLNQVSDAISQKRLFTVIEILHKDLIDKFEINQPRILVTGLNPHAGENGHLGHEEIEIITPVIKRLQRQGLQIQGPLSADSIFQKKYLQNADVILTMYHDQGLPVLKYHSFGKAINVTLGLPIIRTSVDHGTALELAGKGVASNSSLLKAIELASKLTIANDKFSS